MKIKGMEPSVIFHIKGCGKGFPAGAGAGIHNRFPRFCPKDRGTYPGGFILYEKVALLNAVPHRVGKSVYQHHIGCGFRPLSAQKRGTFRRRKALGIDTEGNRRFPVGRGKNPLRTFRTVADHVQLTQLLREGIFHGQITREVGGIRQIKFSAVPQKGPQHRVDKAPFGLGEHVHAFGNRRELGHPVHINQLIQTDSERCQDVTVQLCRRTDGNAVNDIIEGYFAFQNAVDQSGVQSAVRTGHSGGSKGGVHLKIGVFAVLFACRKGAQGKLSGVICLFHNNPPWQDKVLQQSSVKQLHFLLQSLYFHTIYLSELCFFVVIKSRI